MKKALFLLMILFVMVGFLQNAGITSAQETASDSPVMAASAPAQVEYNLAYPGILPDNPLYFLKAARDKLVSFLISDDQKKGEFNLLTSDKRISAAFTLAGEKKSDLAVTTLSKSNNYLEQAVSDFEQSLQEGKDVNSDLSNLKNATQKHEEMLVGIKNRVGSQYSKQIDQEEKRLQKMSKTVNKLVKK